MGSDWKKIQLGDLISITHGYAFKGDDFSEANFEGPIVITIGNFDYTGGFRFESTKIKRCNDVTMNILLHMSYCQEIFCW